MDLTKLAVQLLSDKFGLKNNQLDTLQSALVALIGNKNGIDFAGLVSKMQSGGGLAALASSWLGDGASNSISASQITDLLGNNNIAQFASKLNIDKGTATNGLADVLPQLVDKASSAGSLLDATGGASGLLGFASKFLD